MESSFFLYKGAWVSVLPPHHCHRLSSKEIEKQLEKGGILVRNVYDFDTDEKTSFWFVIKSSFNGMEELTSRTRNKVRRSLNCYDIKRVSADEILKVGLPIFNAALKHYKVKAKPITQSILEERIHKQLEKKSDFWCVYEKGTHTVVALSINTCFKDCCEYNTMKADPKYLNSTYPYYGLLYEMNKYYLNDLKLKYVNDGARSITEHSNIQPFLMEKFNFRKAYCRLQIEYKWWLRLAIKVLYPFRQFIPILKVKAILNMEAMSRGEY